MHELDCRYLLLGDVPTKDGWKKYGKVDDDGDAETIPHDPR